MRPSIGAPTAPNVRFAVLIVTPAFPLAVFRLRIRPPFVLIRFEAPPSVMLFEVRMA